MSRTAPSTSGPVGTDVDGLLGQFIALATVDDYADVDPGSPGAGGTRLPRAVLAGLVAALVGVIAAVAILMVRSTSDTRIRTHAELEQRVAALATSVDDRQAAVDQATARVDDLRARLLDDRTATATDARIDRLANAAGTAGLVGPGLTVTLDDAPGAQTAPMNRVLDRDLQLVVNALWKLGATGIAINGQRLTAQSAIRSAGESILVNYRPVLPPYRVEAIGTSTRPTDDDLQTILDSLHEAYGLVSSVATGDIALPAGEAHIPRFARSDVEGPVP